MLTCVLLCEYVGILYLMYVYAAQSSVNRWFFEGFAQ